PAPLLSVQAFVVAKGSAVEKAPVPVFENRICVTLLKASDAESVSVAFLLLVAVAPLLMTTVPVGARLSTVTEIAAVVAVFPDVSRARACSVCVPFDAVVVFQEKLYGELVSSVPSGLPSSKNCTPATPTSSDAFAATLTVPETVAVEVGVVMATLGGV